jgi:hypothetical protein
MMSSHFKSIFLLFLMVPMCVLGQKYKPKKIFHIEAKSVRFSGDGASGESYFFKPAVELGLGLQYSITARASFSPQLALSQRGYHAKTNYSDSAYVDRTISLNYLDFSPNVEIKLGSLSEYGGGLTVWAGPYLGVGLWDNSTYVSRGLNPLKPLSYVTTTTTGESFSRELRRVDMGFKVGLGIVSQNFVSLGLTYQAGVLNIASGTGSLYNQSLGFYLRVYFDDVL